MMTKPYSRRVVSQEGRPALARRSTALDHVLSDARLRDLKPKLEQFAGNARRPPKQILHAHLPDRRKPTIELDEEPAIVVRKLGPPSHLASQNDQLMSERRILCLKSALRLEWQGQHSENEADQRDHRANLADSIAR